VRRDILPHRAAAEIARGSCLGPVPQPDTAAQPARPMRVCSRPDNLLDRRVPDHEEPAALHVAAARLATYGSLAGSIGLAAQVIFIMFPVIQVWRR
jgi:hypothetical protein